MKKALSAALLTALLLLSACAAPPPTATADTSKPYVTVSFAYAEGLKYSPSFAVWVENDTGETATLFATAKAAAGLKNRPEALPVWTGAREADVASGATPQRKAALTLNLPDTFAGQKLTLYIEANASYDFNSDYPEASGVNGQPSVVWSAAIDTSAAGSASPALAGSGDAAGADHSLHDAAAITTPVLEGVTVEWELGE